MNDVVSPPRPTPTPHRLAILRANLLDQIEGTGRGSRAEPLRALGRPPLRRVMLVFALATLLGAGAAVGVAYDFLGEQDRVDRQPWAPPEMKAAGPRVEVVRGADWSFMAWQTGRSLCVAYAAGAASNWGRSCGQAPDRADDERFPSDYLIATLITPSAGADRRGAIVGAVTAEVQRIELELADGRTLSAATQSAPAALRTDARLFIVRAPIDLGPSLSSGAAAFPVRAYVSYDSAGRRLERHTVG